MSDVSIGPIGNIGPGGKYHGRIVGLKPFGDFAIAGGTAALTGIIAARRAKLQEFNDVDASHILGAAGGGQPVRTDPTDPAYVHQHMHSAPPRIEEDPFFDSPEFESHAREMHRANLNYYHRTVGTPKHRPREPFSWEEQPKTKPMDTSDLRHWTP